MSDPYARQIPTSTSRLSPPSAPASSSSDSSSTATLPSASGIHHLATTIDPQVKQFAPSNDAIEAAIQAAISSSTASASRSSPSFNGSGNRSATSDGRTVPPRDTRTQLFIGNLPYRVRWQDLKDLFRRAGTVLRADVSLGADNRSRGYGTVLLATAEDAGRAIDMFNGYEWQSRLLEVRVDRIGGPTTQPGEPGMSSMSGAVMGGVTMMSSGLYAGQQQQSTQGIPSSSSPFTSQGQNPPYPSHQQQHIFSPQPQVVSMNQFHSQLQIPGQSQFELFQQQQFQPHLQQSQQNPPSIPGRTLFVGNLPYHVQWQDLKDLFRRTPGGVTVLRADVALGPDGRSKGFGTVTLRTEEEAERAKRWFSGYEFNGRQLKVHHDRVPLTSSAPVSLMHSPLSSIASPAGMAHSSSPSMLSQQMAMLNLTEALQGDHRALRRHSQSQRSASPSTTSSSSSSHRQQYMSQSSRLRAESLLAQSPIPMPPSGSPSIRTSDTVRSLSSPLLRQVQAYQQDQVHHHSYQHQPSPLLQPTAMVPRDTRSHSGSISSASEFLMESLGGPSSLASPSSLSVSPVLPTSPSVTRANRPTHIALPTPSFHFDFDPSMASLDSDDYPGNHGALGARNQSRSGNDSSPELSAMQQKTPLQMHFKQYLQRDEAEREQGGQEDYPAADFEHKQQLYQLLHGSRQKAMGAGSNASGSSRQPQPSSYEQHSTTSPHISLESRSILPPTSSSVASATSSPPSFVEGYEPFGIGQVAGSSSLRGSVSSGPSSAAASSKSLPQITTRVSSSKPVRREGSPNQADVRPQSTVSTTGSTTSPSESGLSTSLSGSSRTGSSAPAGVQKAELGNGSGTLSASRERSPGKLRMLVGEQEREKSQHPRHPGSITMPPPSQVVYPARGAAYSAATSDVLARSHSSSSGSYDAQALFKQHYPFVTGEDHQPGDVAEVDYSGVPTVQARPVHFTSTDTDHGPSKKGRKDFIRNHEAQQWSEEQAFRQQQYQQTSSHQQYGNPISQHTPHGLPPMTPSMPPFTFVGAHGQVSVPFQSPGMYPLGAGGASHFQQRRPRPMSDTRVRQQRVAPGTLSLPPQQLAFAPGVPGHQQSPILSPASTIGPPTAGMPPHLPYLHPLGSPGSPYALGPHHPLLQAQQQYHALSAHTPMHYQPGIYAHMPHPLSNSFAGVGQQGLGAMTPGVPWVRPGDGQLYNSAAVGAPIGSMGGEEGRGRSESESQRAEEKQSEGDDASAGGGEGEGWDDEAKTQRQQHFAPGYWVYGHPEMVEPKGYFDQLYMGPTGYRYGAEEGSAGPDERAESQSAVEREILKDRGSEGVKEGDPSPRGQGGAEDHVRPPLGKGHSSEGTTNSSTMERQSNQSTRYGSPETVPTSDEERYVSPPAPDARVAALKPVAALTPAPPGLQHSSTDPGNPGRREPRAVRSATGES